jgi:DNA-directed RNA polymerase subunit RPC12/RpoP
MVEIPVSFRCDTCNAKIEWPDDAIDSTPIICKQCGKLHGTYADLRETALEAVRAKAESIIKRGLKGD